MTPEHSPELPPSSDDRRGASWPELMTKRVPPAMTPRTNFAGSTSSSNVNAPPAAAIRAIAIRNDGPRPPGDATSTRRHTHQASSTWSGSSDDRPQSKARRPIMVDGLFYCGSKNRTIGAFYLLECRVHLGIATPSRQGRERTELNYHATTNCSRLSIPGLDITA